MFQVNKNIIFKQTQATATEQHNYRVHMQAVQRHIGPSQFNMLFCAKQKTIIQIMDHLSSQISEIIKPG